jgi:signal transduction histidine kinase
MSYFEKRKEVEDLTVKAEMRNSDWRLELLVIFFATFAYPVWRVGLLLEGLSEPPWARILPLCLGSIFLYLLWKRPKTRAFAGKMTLILSVICTIEYNFLIFRFVSEGNVFRHQSYLMGSLVIMACFVACSGSVLNLLVYVATAAICNVVLFVVEYFAHPGFFHAVGGLNNVEHVITAVGITSFVCYKRIVLEKQLKLQIYSSQQQMISNAKMVGLGVMAGGVAHEINNPLNVINGFASIVRKGIERETVPKEDMLKALHGISEMVVKAARITDGLLRYSRSGVALRSSFEAVEVGPLIDDVVALSSVRLKSSGIDVKVQRLSQPFVHGDRSQLEEIFFNLIGNAIDAVVERRKDNPSEGERKIEIILEPVNKGFVSISIKDWGEEIPLGNSGRIFDPFFTTKQVGSGTGLGLSVALMLAKNHAGQLQAECGVSPKSVTLTLPVLKTA